MAATMRLWHLLSMTSSAFFRSPRGRWGQVEAFACGGRGGEWRCAQRGCLGPGPALQAAKASCRRGATRLANPSLRPPHTYIAQQHRRACDRRCCPCVGCRWCMKCLASIVYLATFTAVLYSSHQIRQPGPAGPRAGRKHARRSSMHACMQGGSACVHTPRLASFGSSCANPASLPACAHACMHLRTAASVRRHADAARDFPTVAVAALVRRVVARALAGWCVRACAQAPGGARCTPSSAASRWATCWRGWRSWPCATTTAQVRRVCVWGGAARPVCAPVCQRAYASLGGGGGETGAACAQKQRTHCVVGVRPC